MDMMDMLYRNHNIAVMLAVRFAAQLGLQVGLGEDPLELGWPVLYIVLPTGEQVAWRIPLEELVGTWPTYESPHDGHTPDERRARLLRYLSEAGASPAAVPVAEDASTHKNGRKSP